jgi:hypothetical protein
MSDAEVEGKFRSFAGIELTADQCDRALETIWGLDKLPDLALLFDSLTIQR